jgi:hypothetical protein
MRDTCSGTLTLRYRYTYYNDTQRQTSFLMQRGIYLILLPFSISMYSSPTMIMWLSSMKCRVRR